jgi:hypothetical protein
LQRIDFSRTLSKTSFSRGWQCEKHLWLHRFRPELRDNRQEEGKIIKLAGNQVSDLARGLFPNGVMCGEQSLEEEKDWDASVLKTRKVIADGADELIFPSFYTGQHMCDIHFMRKEAEGWRLYVVKTAGRISQNNLINATFQYYVISECDLSISGFSFLLINKKYRREGEIDAQMLFVERNVTKEILNLMPVVKKTVKKLSHVLSSTIEPEVPIGPYCTSPYPCDFKGSCWKNVPDDSVFDLTGLPKEEMFELWNAGIQRISDIPAERIPSNLEAQHQEQKQISRTGLNRFLDKVNYPVLFIDFEGYLSAIPPYSGLKPFELLPFLYCGYLQSSEKDTPRPVSFIADPKEDPRPGFAQHFTQLASEVESILVYDPNTEIEALKTLEKAIPELKEELRSARNKIIDLSAPIHSRHFYLPEMKGLASMKSVLPAIHADLDYSDLNIQSGRMAANTYQILTQTDDVLDQEATMNDLISYCDRDALGLVRIFEALKRAARP